MMAKRKKQTKVTFKPYVPPRWMKMPIRNLNDVARCLCEMEGKKKQVNIAQMKETLSTVITLVYARPFEVLAAVAKRAKKDGWV